VQEQKIQHGKRVGWLIARGLGGVDAWMNELMDSCGLFYTCVCIYMTPAPVGQAECGLELHKNKNNTHGKQVSPNP